MTSMSYQDIPGEMNFSEKITSLGKGQPVKMPHLPPGLISEGTPLEIKGVHLKSSLLPKHAQKSAWRMAIGKPTVMDLMRANQRRRVHNTKRNRDIIIQDLVNKGYLRAESKARLLKTVRVVNGRSYLMHQRLALNKQTLHKDFFYLPTRPGVSFRRPLPGTQLFATRPQLFVQKNPVKNPNYEPPDQT